MHCKIGSPQAVSRMSNPSWGWQTTIAGTSLNMLDCIPIDTSNKEKNRMALGPCLTQGILRAEICRMQFTAAYLPISTVIIHNGDRCISGRSKKGTDARLGRWPSSNGLHESTVEAYKIEVLGLWEAASGSCILLHLMATLLGGLSRRGHCGNRLLIPNSPNGTVGLVLDIVEMRMSWVVGVY